MKEGVGWLGKKADRKRVNTVELDGERGEKKKIRKKRSTGADHISTREPRGPAQRASASLAWAPPCVSKLVWSTEYTPGMEDDAPCKLSVAFHPSPLIWRDGDIQRKLWLASSAVASQLLVAMTTSTYCRETRMA